MAVSLNRKLAFETTLLLLHDLHGDEVLEIRVVLLQVRADVLVRLRYPSRYKKRKVRNAFTTLKRAKACKMSDIWDYLQTAV